MSDQSKDPAPNAADPPRTPQVTSGIETSQTAGTLSPTDSVAFTPPEPTDEHILPSGDTVVVSLDPQGAPVEVVDVIEGDPSPTTLVDVPMPNAEYGYRPEPIPGPSVEELKLMSVEGYPEQPSAQELIMQRAQAQADAILGAAENAVKNMDKAEAAARGEDVDAAPDLRHVSVLDPNTGIVQEDQSVPLDFSKESNEAQAGPGGVDAAVRNAENDNDLDTGRNVLADNDSDDDNDNDAPDTRVVRDARPDDENG